MKRRLTKAAASGARYVLILGDDEIAAGIVMVKSLATGEQASMPRNWIPQGMFDLLFEDELSADDGAVPLSLKDRLLPA